MTEQKKMQGVTLLELLVVLVIGAILTSIAAPSFQNTIKRNRVQSHAHDVSAMLSIARSEAVTRIETVSVCGSVDQAACNDSADWSAGWIVFVDNGAGNGTAADGKHNGTEEIIKTYRYQGTNTLSVKSSADEPLNALSFGPRGAVTQNIVATLRICDKDGDANYARALLLERTGRVVSAHDLYDNSGNLAADGIYEDAGGNNLTCI